jgi:HD-like signal output (HDOD) protein
MSPSLLSIDPETTTAPYTEADIRRRIDACPKLASLQSINQALADLVNSEQSLTSQIAEIIRQDPSLSSRILRMVNSVYFGLSAQINDIEDAVFFLGLRQLRELSVATPVIEDLERLQSGAFPPEMWKKLWAHSIATAILTREILASAPVSVDDETDYLVGLLHNLGKIVMAYAFPKELAAVAEAAVGTPADVCALERQLIGWDHARIGAYFLENHHLADEIVLGVRHHNDPDAAPAHNYYAAAVQVADCLVRHAGIPSGFEIVDPTPADQWKELPGWKLLYNAKRPETQIARASLAKLVRSLPDLLSGLV